MEKCLVESKSLTPGLDCWVVDSGSGNHLISKSECSRDQLSRAVKQEKGLCLSTVNGTRRAEYKAPVRVPVLRQDIWCWLMISSPKVISMHLLVQEEKTQFHWLHSEVCKMELRGQTHYLPVVCGVPLLKAYFSRQGCQAYAAETWLGQRATAPRKDGETKVSRKKSCRMKSR